ncbi:CBS domain-containing protein [Gemmatimonas groenlandica]|uniref:CBS domain-containing protein n=1 Tax=Gemmatimonas groenlandica TaxID=2732249 RepID=A0A6M4IM87_9BACT|nr:CBS domain-containing protein [Gemmatimonas groenlandica]QJR34998.1 CBS domain-containing protein [Gemmatimonas groenlandica]
MPLLLTLLSVALVATLTLAATAVRAVSRLWLRHWIERRHGGTGAMARYLERPARLLHAAATASMLTVFATGSMIAMADGLRAWEFLVDVLLYLTLLVLVGQLLPRAVGRRWAPQLVPVLVPLLRLVDLLLTPFHVVADLVRRLMTSGPASATDDDAREGLEELLRDGAFDDISTTEEMAIISGVVQFGDKVVHDVMSTRATIFALPDGLPAAELASRVAQAGYSRVPIYRDTPDQIIGMVHVFDVFVRSGETLPPIRPVTVTTSTKSAKELLFELLRSRRQLAIVQDDATVVGLVTLEDLLEELVGDIRDEHDDE